MTRLLLMIGAAAMAFAGPALAQHQHHGHQMPAPKPAPKKKPAAKKPTAKKPVAKKATIKKAAPKKAAPKKAGPKAASKKAVPKKPVARRASANETPSKKAGDPHAGHVMPEAQGGAPAGQAPPDPHAGHAMPAATADPHAGHGVGAAVDPPLAPPPPEAFAGPEHAADLFWNNGAMAQSRRAMRREHGALPAYRILIDQMETRVRKGSDGIKLEGDAWFGGDIDKAWLKAEAEGDIAEGLEELELQALWSHAIDPWFDVQAGLRYDLQPGSDQVHLVAGVQGLAPYWIEVDGAAFLSDRGDVTARFEAEHDVRITQKLVLQPRAEFDFALQDIPSERIGSGLSSAELGLRLRYQFMPEFAPYVGINYERAFGDTRRFRRFGDEDAGGFGLLVGLRTWF